MRRRTIVVGLICSVALNLASVFLLANYVHTLGTLKLASQEVTMLSHSLTFAQTANVVTELAAPDKVDKRAFISHFDGEEDYFSAEPVAIPTRTKEVTLFVFLHGMGHNCVEPFIFPKDRPLSDLVLSRDHSYVIMAPNYRAPAGWVSDAALADITQTIRLLCQQYPVKRIFLIGSSMGGCAALSYSAIAPADIKAKLRGLVCIEGAGDLTELYHKTNNSAVKTTLAQCFGGPPEKVSMAYAAKSFVANVRETPPAMRMAIVSARQDHTVPPELQDQVFTVFKAGGHEALMIPVEMDHGWPNQSTVNQALDFVLTEPPKEQKKG